MLNRFNIKRIINQPKLIIIALSSLNPVRKFSFLLHSKDIHSSDTFDRETILEYNQYRKYGIRKSICYAADSNLYFDIYGNIFLCCYNRKYLLGNINATTIQEIWKGEKRKNAVLELSKNNLPDGCSICYQNISQKEYDSSMSMSFDLYSTGQNDFPKRMDFECSNICNLECIMCNGEFSNLIRKNRENRVAIKNPYSSSFIDQLAPYLKHLEYANFMGGEPQLINIYFTIWEKLAENKKCLIRIQTNATIVTDRFKKIVENSNQFQISLSIDSLKQSTFEKIRLNGNFSDYVNNVAYYINLHKKNKIELSFSVCPLRTNQDELTELVEFANSNSIRIYFNQLFDPYYLCLRSETPERLKETATSIELYLQKTALPETIVRNNITELKKILFKVNEWINISASNTLRYSQKINNSVDDIRSYYKDCFIKLYEQKGELKLAQEFLQFIEEKLSDYPDDVKKHIYLRLSEMDMNQTNHDFFDFQAEQIKSNIQANIIFFAAEYENKMKIQKTK